MVRMAKVSRAWRAVAFLAATWMAVGLGAATAAQVQQEPSGGGETQPRQSIIGWVYHAEGCFFFPQMAISVGVIALIGSNFFGVLRSNFVPADFAQAFESLVKDKKFKEAFDLAKNEDSFLGRLVSTGMQRLAVGYQEAITAMQELGEEENMKYEHRLSYLALIGNIATLVGLLGTVWGMVASFMVIGSSDVAPKPSVLAQGVSQALVTTVLGLLQAIPAIICFTVFKNRVARLTLEVGMLGEQLMQPFKAVSVRRPADAAQPAATTPAAS